MLDQQIVDPKAKEWLYSMVTINMAYLQFGAGSDGSGSGLNGLIRRKLKGYLPEDVLTHPGFLQKVE